MAALTWRKTVWACTAACLAAAGCTAISSGRPLSGVPPRALPAGIYVLTAPPTVAYQTVGFVQVTTRGAALADVPRVSDTELDPNLRGALLQAAHDAGAEGAIVVACQEVWPPTAASRPWAAVDGPPGRVATRARRIVVQAELFRFLRAEAP